MHDIQQKSGQRAKIVHTISAFEWNNYLHMECTKLIYDHSKTTERQACWMKYIGLRHLNEQFSHRIN